ncbi:MAG: hypothetical protein WAW52_04500 [Methanothrix sp.]
MSGIVDTGAKFAGQLPDSFLELLLVGMKIPLQERKAEGLGLGQDEGGVEFVLAGLLLVGEMQEVGDSVAVVHGFVAGEAAVLSARPGDDGVFRGLVVGLHEM